MYKTIEEFIGNTPLVRLQRMPQAQIEPQLASWREVRMMLGDGFDAMFRSNTAAGRVAEILAIMESTSRDLTK